MDQQLKSNLTSPKHWVRLVYMLLFAFCLYIASFIVGILVIVQFLFALITGIDNRKLREFGGSLTLYIKQVLLFLTFNSEFKAFPFADWPEAPLSEDAPVAETPAANPPIIVPPPIADIPIEAKPDDEGRPVV
jgi:hypothetical protein